MAGRFIALMLLLCLGSAASNAVAATPARSSGARHGAHKKASERRAQNKATRRAQGKATRRGTHRAGPKHATHKAHPHQVNLATPAARLELSGRDVAKRVSSALGSLGPMSVGHANSGALVNGVKMSSGHAWTVVAGSYAWATQETIDYLTRAIAITARRHPSAPKMRVGDLSARRGGKLRPHRSHQSGRDVDVSYYYRGDQPFRWYRPATANNLDRAKTWTFVRALLTQTDVEMIFINTSLQRLLKSYALSIGEDKEWLDSVFQIGSRHPWPLVRHFAGHDTHIHIRFHNPVSQEMGRKAFRSLVRRGVIKPATYYTTYTARRGDMLGRIAKRFDCTVKEIQKANKLRSSRILAGRVYKIPRRGDVKPPGRAVLPPRRLPPPPSGSGVGRATAAADYGS